MAVISSLGLHEPSALSYLVSEGLLPVNPLPSYYRWQYQRSLDANIAVTDEILQTATCVVWSRNGVIKRVFNLDVENEIIKHAFTTRFKSTSDAAHQHLKPPSTNQALNADQSALVVVLKTQAHIFLLSGDTHVVPLSFEVSKAIPAAYGFLLQRSLSSEAAFAESLTPTPSTGARSFLMPTENAQNHVHNDSPIIKRTSRTSNQPCVFAFPELLAELSIVVSGSARKHEPFDCCPVMSPSESILYVSTTDEMYEPQAVEHESVHFAVTCNSETKSLTLWQLAFKQNDLDEGAWSRKNEKPGYQSKRKSSNVYGRQTGIATPTLRGPGPLRESIGGPVQSTMESGVFAQHSRETQGSLTADLAAQLGPEFDVVGVQTRSARRVSSMLARTDLGAANDRSAFNEINHSTLGRKSFGRSLRRGESIGGFSDRQSFGPRRRSSFQAANSTYSDSTSFLDIPASHLTEDGNEVSGQNSLPEALDVDTSSNISRNVAFLKIKSLPYELGAQSGDDNFEDKLKVMVLLAPDRSTADDRRNRIISVCIMDRTKREMTIFNVAAKLALPANRQRLDRVIYDLKAVEVQRGQAVVDACVIGEGTTKRLLILTHTREGRSVLHLEAPWSVSYQLDLPTQLKVFSSTATFQGNSPASRRDTGTHRIIPISEIDVQHLRQCDSEDQVLAMDAQDRCHRLSIRLMPAQSLTQQVLQMSNLVLPPELHDSMLVAWWEVKRWLQTQAFESNVEWTAMVVTIFLLAVPFITNLQTRSGQSSRRKKGGALRSSSGTAVDLSHWNAMQELEKSSTQQALIITTAWAWTSNDPRMKNVTKSPGKHSRNASLDTGEEKVTDPFLIECTALAHDFLQSPAGENAIGPEGYLPIAVNKDRNTRRTALASIQVGVHLLREELKLHAISSGATKESPDSLAMVIVQLGNWLQWRDWCLEPGRYYHTEVDSPTQYLVESSVIDKLDVPPQPFTPPSVFEYVEHSMTTTQLEAFPTLLDLLPRTKPIIQNHPLWKSAAKITPWLFALAAFVSQFCQKKNPRSVIKQMLNCGINGRILNTLPIGIATIFYQSIVSIKGQSKASWSKETKALLERVDLSVGSKVDQKAGLQPVSHVHDAVRDYRIISNNAIETDSISRWDAFSEFDRQAVTKLIFHDDRRFQEASRLVNQTRPPVVQSASEPGWSEADVLEAQKELAVHVTRRTLSVATGRAMMHYNARVPLLTEKVPIPAFNLQCVMISKGDSDTSHPMTLSADKALFTEDKVCWAFFHNGASAGLMISKDTRWIDTSWILYNKPPELTNRHAGFLLALGLNGHLKSLAKWVAFKYLTPKHTMTSVGLLLGLAASYLGTMDTLIARLLSVHVTRLLPIGAAELNLSPLTQTTGIMGVGLLYYNSQHRRMSEIMLSEIENNDSEDRSGDEAILRDEGYRLVAGFSLGLINLGHGKKLHSLHDMNVTERLLTIAVGTKNVNMVHVLDRATAGAVIAVAFIFMKTNDRTVAQKIDIPDTMHQFDYVRPDIFLLRTLARHLIMWDSIQPTQDFMTASLPVTFRKRADLSTTKRLSTDDLPYFNVIAGICFAMSLRFAGSHRLEVRDLLLSYLDQILRLSKLPALNYDAKVTLNGVRNCLDVLALSCAIVMSGSGDIPVLRRLRSLHGRTDKDTPFGSHLAAHMALGILFLSGGTATFGTNNLAIAALVISLYPLFPVDVLDNKAHLQALRHLWVLAVENRCLIVRDVETQQIVTDLQAEVELHDGGVFKMRTPCLLPQYDRIRKISFHHENYWPVQIDLGNSEKLKITTKASKASGTALRSLDSQTFTSHEDGVKVFLQRRTAYEKPDTDTFFAELQALDEARRIPSTDVNAGVNEKWRQVNGPIANPEEVQKQNPFDWIFQHNKLKSLDSAERSLVLDERGSISSTGRKILDETAVDSLLSFEIDCLGVDDDETDATKKDASARVPVPRTPIRKDKLWQLRLLFTFMERWEQDEEEAEAQVQVVKNDNAADAVKPEPVRWIKQEVLENLRDRVWNMAGG